MTQKIHYWYEFASPYSFLTAMRIEDLAKEAGVKVIWHPFLLGAIYKMMNLPAPPMQLTPQKEAYMWLDSARQARRLGIKFKNPSQFPRVAVLSSRIALIGREEGWCPEFTRRVYLANFLEDKDISQPEVNREILGSMGLDAEDILARAVTPENKRALMDETQEALEKGIFGVPTFFVGDEIFWGNDRLEQALEAASSS